MNASRIGRRDHLQAIILAAGRGERLLSLTTSLGKPLPKQFCDFGRGRTLLEETIDRVRPEIPTTDLFVVVDASQVAHAGVAVGRAVGARIVAQPCDRGTAAGVLLPLMHVLESVADATVLITPCDHGIRNEHLFRGGIRRARRAIANGESDVVLLAAQPSAPNADYGWVVPGEELASGLYDVKGFEEKPPRERARELWSEGALWNTMLVLADGRALWRLYKTLLPEMTAAFEVAMTLERGRRDAYLQHRYERLKTHDFCRDVLARAPCLRAVLWPSAVGWTDLGTPERMRAWLAPAEVPQLRENDAGAQCAQGTT